MSHVKFTPYFKRFVAVSAVSFAVALAAAGLDWYLFEFIRERAAVLVETKQKVLTFELERAALMKERGRVKKLEPSIAAVEAGFVDASRPLDFIESLENLAKRNAAAIKLGLPEKRNYALAMRVEAEGAPGGVLAFVRGVELMPGQVIFESATFERLTKKTAVPVRTKGRIVPPEETARIAASIEFLAK